MHPHREFLYQDVYIDLGSTLYSGVCLSLPVVKHFFLYGNMEGASYKTTEQTSLNYFVHCLKLITLTIRTLSYIDDVYSSKTLNMREGATFGIPRSRPTLLGQQLLSPYRKHTYIAWTPLCALLLLSISLVCREGEKEKGIGSNDECKTRFHTSLLQDQNTSGTVSGLPKSGLENSYLNHSHGIGGWMSPIHHQVAQYLSKQQIDAGVSGLIGEIGVHHGKYFFSLATNLVAPEYAVAFDVFEDQNLNVDGSGQGSLQIFMEHASSIGFPRESIKVEKGDSNSITSERLKAISASSYRIFSVDGGHTRETTLNDLFLAQSVLHTQGFAVLDDFVNPEWLGVVDGLFTFMNKCNGGLKPFLWLCSKLYLSHESFHHFYFDSVQKMGAVKCSSMQSNMHESRYKVNGYKVCVARETG